MNDLMIRLAMAQLTLTDDNWHAEATAIKDAANEIARLSKLEKVVAAFIEKQEVSCPEVIYQSDRVIENAYEFIEALVDIVGYYEYPEDES